MTRRSCILSLAGLTSAILLGESNAEGFWRFRRCRDNSTPIVTGPTIRGLSAGIAAWERLKLQMSEDDVLRLLGTPESKTPGPSPGTAPSIAQKRRYSWRYGEMDFATETIPNALPFVVHFANGQVVQIEDPFKGARSVNGLPTTPILLSPTDGAAFQHYPRFIDFRWTPSFGHGTITYELQLELGQYEGMEISFRPILQRRTLVPHIASSFPGKNRGRWRVRSINFRSASDWSEYCTFSFEV